MSTSALRVAIVGGGIGGAAAANALLQRGIDVHVYEQASALTEVGAGVAIQSNSIRLLRRLMPVTPQLHGLKEGADLASTFTRVAEELHTQYVIGFTPEVMDGKLHALQVRVKRPGMSARTRKSYVASPDK